MRDIVCLIKQVVMRIDKMMMNTNSIVIIRNKPRPLSSDRLEQATHNRLVAGSNPAGVITFQ